MSDTVTRVENVDKAENWRAKLFITGAAAGALVGVLTAYLLARNVEEEGGDFHVNTSDLIKMSIGIISTMRGIATLGKDTS